MRETEMASSLLDVIADLDNLDEDHTIYAALIEGCWTETSPAVVTLPPKGKIKDVFNGVEMNYFLEVDLAREVLEDWAVYSGSEASQDQEKFRVLAHYAQFDAMPLIEKQEGNLRRLADDAQSDPMPIVLKQL